MAPDCPAPQELSDFALGKLPEDRSESVAHHLEECPPCQATLTSLDSASDTLVSELQKPFAADPVEQQAECRQAVAQIKTMVSLSAAGDADSQSQHTADTHASDAAQPAAATSPAPKTVEGRVFGEYTVLDRLGAGGMGEVFKARHRRMNRIVAIKVLASAAMRSPDAVKRFQREVEAAARLSHPNIVTAYDAGEQDGVHYLVMEYVAGRDLSSLLRERGPLPPADVVNYLVQAARGLGYAHNKGVVHRDIKPGNLLLDEEGTVKVLDMGLARFDAAAGDVLTAAQEGLTQSGQVMGTVDYMAPEQAFDTRQADARADIYSLGCTMYRLLTGESLFTGETLVQKLLAHREQAIPSLRAARPELSEALDRILARMVAKQPQERYASMGELIHDLEAVHSRSLPLPPDFDKLSRGGEGRGEGVSFSHSASRSHHRATSSSSAPPRKPRPALIAAAAAGALCVLLGIVIIIRNQKGEEVARVTAPDGATVSIQPSDSNALDNAKPPAAAAAERGVLTTSVGKWIPGPAKDSLEGLVARPTDLPGVRRWQIDTIQPRDGSFGNWSSDGNRFIYLTSGQRRVYQWQDDRPQLAYALPLMRGVSTNNTFTEWAADSERLVTSNYHLSKVSTWRIRDREVRPETQMQTSGCGRTAWSPDGKWIAGAAGNNVHDTGSLSVWNARTGELVHKQTDAIFYRGLSWRPDSRQLAGVYSQNKNSVVRVWDADSWQTAATLEMEQGCHVGSLGWSPDQQELVIFGSPQQTNPHRVHFWNIAQNAVRLKLDVMSMGSKLSSDGKWISTWTSSNNIQLVSTTDGTKGIVLPVACAASFPPPLSRRLWPPKLLLQQSRLPFDAYGSQRGVNRSLMTRSLLRR